jgi:ribosomal protein L11 methyltransferase
LEPRDLAGQSVLDYGCGSGVLAIASLLLGARRAWACDTDRQALEVTAENAARNDVASRLWTGEPSELPPLQADIVVANILSGTLVDLAPELGRRLRPGGHLVLAGLLKDQVPDLVRAYEHCCELHAGHGREGWVLLQGRAPSDHS